MLVAAEAAGFDYSCGIGNHGQEEKGQQHNRKISLEGTWIKNVSGNWHLGVINSSENTIWVELTIWKIIELASKIQR